jgi:Tfp pilus assembly protein PilO
MSASMHRETFSHGVIIAAVCIGAWMLFVQPKVRETAELEAQLAAANPDAGGITQTDIEAAGRRMAQIKQRLAAIQESNDLSHDTSKLYGLIMDLAGKHGIAVQTISPGARQKGREDYGMTLTRIEISAEGRYDHVAAFLDAVANIGGFLRPVSLSVAPLSDGPTGAVIVRYGCEALTFELPPALAAMAGGDHGQH